MERSQRQQFGLNLAAERKKAGLSQEDLAFRADLHRTEVSLIERGLREPRLETFLKLSRGLGVQPATLIEGISWAAQDTMGALEVSVPALVEGIAFKPGPGEGEFVVSDPPELPRVGL